MLAEFIGPQRIAAQQEAAVALIHASARLPLALAIAAARAAVSADLPLAELVGELRDSARRLDALEGGDPFSSVRAVTSWSYRLLSEPATRMFRLLGLHPGPDISAAAAASLAGVSLEQAGQLLNELASFHLLTEHATGRYARPPSRSPSSWVLTPTAGRFRGLSPRSCPIGGTGRSGPSARRPPWPRRSGWATTPGRPRPG